ncbi:ABC transporter ATP-binding protein [Fulvivirga ligni]|uniref:ABC transporter ATP-binding protein n=1 Tax=Fulvivirga ligni TaxID=2904246 RepID=UPI001F2FA14C|nr:ABC transporter ATP-binding protein [Fulvivirga ligni]UII23274.1 ABC transporter ATP-binding protein [Fulvivirga ligni]
MKISIEKLGKRYQNEWIFRNFNYTFYQGKGYALTGHNGSGKSTLLKIISGYHLFTEGQISYFSEQSDNEIPIDSVFEHFTVATPYMELIEDFTLAEHLDFHFKFRKITDNISPKEIMEIAWLSNSAHKYIKNFSSGMKQRLKLALTFYTKSDYVLLDEPTSNLDAQGIDWYHAEIEKIASSDKTLIIASNQLEEYEKYCPEVINLTEIKPSN